MKPFEHLLCVLGVIAAEVVAVAVCYGLLAGAAWAYDVLAPASK